MKKINYILKGLFVFFLGINGVWGQGTTQNDYVPKIIPPSPNAASLGKYGDIPVGYYTGIPNISIPLYTITEKGLSHSISISYHASGIKVAEEAGRVGLGWALNAGGVISRNILGADDFRPSAYFDGTELPFGYKNKPTSNFQLSTGYIARFSDIYNSTIDVDLRNDIGDSSNPEYQPDIYNFNIAGVSGKFVVKRNKEIVLQKNEKIKIEMIGNISSGTNGSDITWKITIADGTSYFFDEIETSLDQENQFHVNSWYLTKIKSFTGDEVTFSYTTLPNVRVYSQGSISETKLPVILGSPCPSPDGTSPPAPPSGSPPRRATSINYSLKYLTEINSSNQKIIFNYNDEIDKRLDVDGDKKLISVQIYVKGGESNRPLKEFVFQYDYFEKDRQTPIDADFPSSGYGSLSKRLKLVSVNEKMGTNSLPAHEFTYLEGNNYTTLPAKTSYAVDHWGYFNGKFGNTSLIPTYSTYPSSDEKVFYLGIPTGTERDTDPEYVKAFSLSKIKYPTGGESLFTYEANEYDINNSQARDFSLSGRTGLLDIEQKTVGYNITNRNQVQEIEVDISDGITQPGTTITNMEFNVFSRFSEFALACSDLPSTSNQIYFELKNKATGAIITSVDMFTSNRCTDIITEGCINSCNSSTNGLGYKNEFRLSPGKYTIRAFAVNTFTAGNKTVNVQDMIFTIKYYVKKTKNSSAKGYSGGLRIKTITTNDGRKNEVVNYQYESIENTIPKRSSGIRMAAPQYSYWEKILTNNDLLPPCANYIDLLKRSSNNIFPLNASASGSVIGYSVVSVTRSESSSEGKTIYYFDNKPDLVNDYSYFRTPHNASIPYESNGNLLKEETFNANGDLLKIVENKYSNGNTEPIIIWGLDARTQSYFVGSAKMYRTDEFFFYPTLTSTLTYLSERKETIFDPINISDKNRYVENKENYTYDVKTHLQLQEKIATTSRLLTDGISPERKQTLYKYPSDFANSGNVYEGMTNLHNFSTVISEQVNLEKIVSGNKIFEQVFLKKIDYRKWKNSRILNTINYPDLYAPEKIKIQSKNIYPIQEEISFLDYDDYGNLLKYRQKNGLTTTLSYFTNFATNKGLLHLLSQQKVGGGTTGNDLAESTVTSYTYQPLVGIKTITDPNGKITTYNYDNFNRLNSISDGTGILKTYAYNYGLNPDTNIPLIENYAYSAPDVQKCEMCCLAEAEASNNSPINNCTSGQILLSSKLSSTGSDIKYIWSGPNSFSSTEQNPIITGDITKAGGVYTLVVTKLNSTCETSAIATTNVLLDCICPFSINTNGTTSATLTCQETISLVGNCVGCSTGDPLPGTESYVINGRFNDENVVNPGFNSDNGGGFFTTNPNNLNGTFNNFGDHTGGGNMFLSGGSDNTNERVWYQTVTIKPNTRYVISAWVTSAYNNNSTKVNWDINGVILPEQVDMANKIGGQWIQLKSSWLSGNQTSIVLAIRKQNTQSHNWFAFDDISITEVQPAAKYSWSGPDNFVSTSRIAFVRNVGLKNAGEYILTIVDNGCTQISKVNISVNCQPCLDVNPLTVYVNTNTPVSCGSMINLAASTNKIGVSYTWYKINPDGTDEIFPNTIKNLRNPSIIAPSATGLNRYGYMVAVFKNGCTASYTAPVEVKCIQDGDVDIALNLRIEGGNTNVTAGQTFGICADMTNQSATRNAGSVRTRVVLPDCLEYQGNPWGLDAGQHPERTEGFYEDTWYNTANREVSNLSSIEHRGNNAWQYWGVPIGANQTRSMCFNVKALSSGTIVIKGQVAVIETTQWQNMKDSDSEPNNGYDNGEDDRAVLTLNTSSNTLDVSSYQIRTSFSANSNNVDVISGNVNWTASASDSWITISHASGGNATTTIAIALANNISAKSRFGYVTIKAACGLEKTIKIKQSGKDDCPTVDLSSNNPYCNNQLQLFANIVPSVNKDLVANGSFEKGNIDFNSENYHYYNWQAGGSLSYVISSNPKTENGNIGMWFIDKECPGENTNPNCQLVNRVRLLFRNDCCWDRLNGAKIQGSNNKSQWNDLYTFGNATGMWQDVTFSNTSKYMYVRFVAGSNGYGELREIEFYNGSTKLSGQVFGSPDILGGYGLANATDGLETTFWHSTDVGENAYIGLELSGCSLSGNVATSVSGSGKQMAVAASWRQREAFWSQTILVDPYTDYNISVKAVQLGNYDNVPLQLIFDVDGVPTTIQGNLSTTGCTWQKIGGLWNSGEKFGPVKLTIRFVNPNANNKFFAIDDISVKPNITGTTSNNPITYSWTTPTTDIQPDLITANIANPVINNTKGKHAGIYTLTVLQNGCPVTETIDVDIACSATSCPAPTLKSPYARVCTNMEQRATINAYGCPLNSTVKWSDGQTSATLPYTNPITGVASTISTIQTAKILTGTNYSAQCLTDCGISNKSLDLFIHAVGVPNTPVIAPGPVIEKLPGADGTILYASGCNDGIIKWSNGTTGSTTWIPTLGFRIGDYVEVTAVCKTECAESGVSNKVKLIVVCPVQNPTSVNIVSAPSCTSSGGNAILEGTCPVGTLVWFKDGDGSFVMLGNRITTWINTNTRFRARCEYSQHCVSDLVNLDVSVGGKPNKPTITSEPSNAETPMSLTVGINSTVVLSANSCPSGSTVNWSLTGYSLSGAVGSSISITPTVSGTITAKATCSTGTCSSDPSDTFSISTIGAPSCGNLSFSISPITNPINIPKNSMQTLSASGCFDGTNYGVVRWYLGTTKLVEKNMSSTATPLTVNVNTSNCGTYFYNATCNIGNCEAIVSKTINVICGCTKVPMTLSLDKGTEICGETQLIATVSNPNVNYQWFYRANALATISSLSNTNRDFFANIDGDYFVKVIDRDDPDCFTTSTWLTVEIKKSITSIPIACCNTTIYPSGTASLTATGCPSGTTYIWSDGINTGTPISVSPSMTTTYTVKCKETNGTATCESSNSASVTVTVICGSTAPILEYDSPTSKVCPDISIRIKASGCTGIVKWYDSADGITFTYKESGITSTTNRPKIWASCTASGSTCESAKTPIETQIDFGRVEIVPNCDSNVLTALPNDATKYSYKWQKGGNFPVDGVPTLSVTESDTYILYVKLTGTSCEKTTAFTLDVRMNKKPTVSLSQAPASTGCGNVVLTATVGNTTLALPPYHYILKKGNTKLDEVTSSLTTKMFTISDVGTNDYTIEVTSVDGCVGASTASVTVGISIPVPTITAPVTCYSTGGTGVVLTATGCLSNTYKWLSGETTNSITVTPSSSTDYMVKCITSENCSGNYSTKITINKCPLPLPTVCNGTTITPVSGGASGYSNIFNYSGGVTGTMNAVFDTYCIPDQLTISIKSPGATTFTTVVGGKCMGAGVLASPPSTAYCGNVVNDGGLKTYPFNVTDGDQIKVEVTPNCASGACYSCPTGITQWRLQFTCPVAY